MKLLLTMFFIFFISFNVRGESIRALISGVHRVSLNNIDGINIPMSYVSSSLIELEGDLRFIRGIQLELTAPQSFLANRGSLAAALYGDLRPSPGVGTVDLETRRLAFEPLPPRLQIIYQIPLRAQHGLRTGPFATVLTDVLNISSFPLLFRIMPVVKGISSDIERMTFNLNVKPILSDEGALRLNIRFPDNLPGRPLRVLINDELIENPGEERLLREGEYHLVILSEDYRNLSSRFVVERARVLDLTVELQDPTPLVFFEYPESTRIFINNVFVSDPQNPRPLEPGVHELRFELSDYTIIRPLVVQRGKNYRVAMSVDVNISEQD